MSILCKLFGHKVPKGYNGGPKYFTVVPFATDGLGAEHAEVRTDCARCGEEFLVGRIHLIARLREKSLERETVRLSNELAASAKRFMELHKEHEALKAASAPLSVELISGGCDDQQAVILAEQQAALLAELRALRSEVAALVRDTLPLLSS